MPATSDVVPIVVRVRPDEAAIGRDFDYLVPPGWTRRDRELAATVGARVRIVLHGRRVGGWVVASGVEPPPGVTLRPLAKLSGWGPTDELVDLAEWAAQRWVGSTVPLLSVASPPTIVDHLPDSAARPPSIHPVDDVGRLIAAELATWSPGDPPLVVRLPPSSTDSSVPLALMARGPVLVVAPSVDRARTIGIAMRRAGAAVGLAPRDWARGRSGASMVGSRGAAWAPVVGLAGVVVIDEHDEVHKEERAPTWSARDVAIERGRRAGVPVVLTSAAPSLEARRSGRLVALPRQVERAGWPLVEVIDRRGDDPRSGLYSERLTPWLRGAGPVVCVVNRTGRSRLLACSACGEIARCEKHDRPLVQADASELLCPDDGDRRPVVCDHCGSTRLKNLRAGVSRVREEIEALAGRPVAEVTGTSGELDDRAEVYVGTEAALHRVERANVVAFLDFDQELLAPRYRAAEQAMALLVRAARLLGDRTSGSRLVIQTRLPRHETIQAALLADPDRLARADDERRRELSRPPYSAEALVSGAAAAEFVARIPHGAVSIRGPLDGAYLIRAPDTSTLTGVLGSVDRPAGRLRIDVDPLRT